jgi:hypothetical protein
VGASREPGVYSSAEVLNKRSTKITYVHSAKNIGNTINFLAKSKPASQIQTLGKKIVERRESALGTYLPLVDEESERSSNNELDSLSKLSEKVSNLSLARSKMASRLSKQPLLAKLKSISRS